MNRPEPTECAPFYLNYINELSEADIIAILERQLTEAIDLFHNIPAERADYQYAPGKWSVKEVLGHLVDTERLFAYRAMCMARNDKTPLPAMEQDDYVKHGKFAQRTLPDLAEEFRCVRLASIVLFRSFDDEVSVRKGTASGFEFTVRTFPFIVAGHTAHHLRMLKEKYLQ